MTIYDTSIINAVPESWFWLGLGIGFWLAAVALLCGLTAFNNRGSDE